MEVVRAHGGTVIATGALVDRGKEPARFDDLPFFSLTRLDVPVYDPSACPLCQSGSTAVKPGSRPKKQRSA